MSGKEIRGIAEAERESVGPRIPFGRIALGVAALAALAVLGREAGAYVPRFASWVAELGPWGPLAFVAGYAVATVAFVPGSAMTLAAGAIFGLVEGTLLVLAAATLGSIAAFVVARYFARDAIARRVEGDPRFAAIDRAIEREGRRIVLLLRLSPVFPFNLLNYALGLTRVRLWDYAVASIGMLPGTLLFVYSGKVAGEVAALAAHADVQRGTGYYLIGAVGLVATALVTVFVTRIARRALAEATAE